MTARLPIPASRVLLVAQAAEVCRATVDRYRHGLPLRRAQERAIERAVREMPAEAQMSLESVADKVAAKPVASIYLISPHHSAVSKMALRQAELPRRCHVTIVQVDEHGAPVAAE